MGHKSSAATRWWAQHETASILATRRAVASAHREGTSCGWPDGQPHVGEYESASHRHWRLRHKNLSRPLLRTKPVRPS